jgi:hypothetical protein
VMCWQRLPLACFNNLAFLVWKCCDYPLHSWTSQHSFCR